MPTMNISLPESLRQFVEQQVASRGYNSTSEYLRDLVRDDLKRLAKDDLERQLLDAMREPGSDDDAQVLGKPEEGRRGTQPASSSRCFLILTPVNSPFRSASPVHGGWHGHQPAH